MTENGWQAAGRLVKQRRERLGLRQDELAQYGGPRVSTVGKFERAAQESFPLRTQHQLENALGWTRGTIEDYVKAVDEGDTDLDDFEYELVHENVPDMSRPTEAEAGTSMAVPQVVEQARAFLQVFALIPSDRQEDALRAALVALLRFLDDEGAAELGSGLRRDYPPNGGDGNADADTRGSAPMKLRDVSDLEVDEAAYPDGDDKE